MRLRPVNIVYWLLIFLLLAIAFIARVNHLATNIQLDSDFGRDSLFALRILQGHLTLLGPAASVGGFYLGPFYYYLVALIYFIFGLRPEVMTIVFISMGVGTLYLGFEILRRNISTFAGTLFVLLAAFNPALVAASQYATNQPMMPFVTVLFISVYFWALKKQTNISYLISGLSFGLFFHVHYSALLIFIPLLPIMYLHSGAKLKTKAKLFLFFLLGLTVMLSPLIIFDVRHHFVTLRSGIQYAKAAATGGAISTNLPHLTLIKKISLILGLLTPTIPATIGLLGLSVLGTLGMRKRKYDLYTQTLILLSLGSLVLILLYCGYIYSYYLLIPFTVFLLTLSVVLSRIRPKVIPIMMTIIIFILGFVHVKYSIKYRTVDNLSQVVKIIESDMRSHPRNKFAIFKDSSDQMTGLGYEYRFLLEKDGYYLTSESSYGEATILYYIREEGQTNPLTSSHVETTDFSATSAQLLSTLKFGVTKIDIFRLTK